MSLSRFQSIARLLGGLAERYVLPAVVARNLHRMGTLLREQEYQRAQRKVRRAERDPLFQRAA